LQMRLLPAALTSGFLMTLAPWAFAQDVQPAAEAPATPTTTVVADPAAPPAAPEAAQPAVRTVVVHEKDHDTMTDIQTGGLGLEWVYLNADMGVAYTDLVSLKATNWA